MYEIIGVTEMQRRFRAIFDRVVQGRVPYILTRGSRPEAALIPYDDFQRFQEMEERMVLARFDLLLERLAVQGEAYSEDEVVADVAAARSERGK